VKEVQSSTDTSETTDDETDRIADMPTVATSGTQDHVSSDGETDEEDAANKGTGLDAKEDNANKSKKVDK